MFIFATLDKATMGVEQNNPMFTPGVAKSALSLAYAKSQEAISWQPAAVATHLLQLYRFRII